MSEHVTADRGMSAHTTTGQGKSQQPREHRCAHGTSNPD
eukprot:CAMPEP_0203967162 /NCGR_PEP_ID=MMETSP0359-20131031/96221_1 /ASSEMBLY_ACC=CAM_ASM_000338 /TAXON_ID=268821 /ORGANISM="Scrippsiella Hangoei, Strain SHTV-5" /LENGTH=38 /DNA_ID= /DNA_START= /DNA_END= /DNA_ORIENTATION=